MPGEPEIFLSSLFYLLTLPTSSHFSSAPPSSSSPHSHFPFPPVLISASGSCLAADLRASHRLARHWLRSSAKCSWRQPGLGSFALCWHLEFAQVLALLYRTRAIGCCLALGPLLSAGIGPELQAAAWPWYPALGWCHGPSLPLFPLLGTGFAALLSGPVLQAAASPW